ncbi:DUF3592 domain-containing protein [Streptomyces sp. NPDC026673]|uniref:DUF3592 domain-containing protein n=1 Tax=Streptomyces sp. NPDC026673 TaxID=3155724 RepID=UPI0033EB7B87
MRGGRRLTGWGSGSSEDPGRAAGEGSANALLLLVVGGLFLVAGVWFLTATARDTLALRHGVHTVGTVREQRESPGEDRFWVTFTVAGAEVTHRLPATTNRGQLDDGDLLAIVYHADRPDRVIARRDIGNGPLLFWSGFAAVGLALVARSGLRLRHTAGRRTRGDAGHTRS